MTAARGEEQPAKGRGYLTATPPTGPPPPSPSRAGLEQVAGEQGSWAYGPVEPTLVKRKAQLGGSQLPN